MFTWICPQCGREVPPAYNDCPDCTAKTADVAPPQPLAGNLEDTATLSPLFAAPPPPPPPKQRAGAMLPTWALAVLFAMAFLGVGLGVYAIATRNHASNREAAAATNVDSPAAKPGTKVNVLQKYIEVSGVRFSQDKQDKKVINVSIVLINHSDVDVDRLTGNVTVWGRTRNSEEDAVGTFAFIAGTALKELVLPFNTKLKFIELPDWQNITVDVQITGPATY